MYMFETYSAAVIRIPFSMAILRLKPVVIIMIFVATVKGFEPYVDQPDKYVYGKPEPINAYDSNTYVSKFIH